MGDTSEFAEKVRIAMKVAKDIHACDLRSFRDNFSQLTAEDLSKPPVDAVVNISRVIEAERTNMDILRTFVAKYPQGLDVNDDLVGPPLIQAVNKGWFEAALHILEVRPSTYAQTFILKRAEDLARSFGIVKKEPRDALYWAKDTQCWPAYELERLEKAMATARERAAHLPPQVPAPESIARG